jgi:hypothetical protein
MYYPKMVGKKKTEHLHFSRFNRPVQYEATLNLNINSLGIDLYF